MTYSYERFVAGVDEDLVAAGLDPKRDRRDRAMVDAALRRGRVRRRVRTEALYVSVGPRLRSRVVFRGRASSCGFPPDAL